MHLESPSKYTPPPEAELGSGEEIGGREQRLGVSSRPELLPPLSPSPLLASFSFHSYSPRRYVCILLSPRIPLKGTVRP